MEQSVSVNIEEVLGAFADLKARVERLEAEVAALRGDLASDDGRDDVVLDFDGDLNTLEDGDVISSDPIEAVPTEEVEPVVEEEQRVEEAEQRVEEGHLEAIGDMSEFDAPADGDLPEALFGTDVPEEVHKPKKGGHRTVRSINDTSKTATAVIDVLSAKAAWRQDMPGPEVKDIRSGIALNDRVQFISTLFREDSMLYQDTVGKLNGVKTLDDAVRYLVSTFPEWNMDSENVYRFMMAVRRKLR